MIETRVRDVMNAPVRTVGSAESVVAAARTLSAHDIGSLVVTQGGDVAGIVTESDVVRVVAGGGDPEGVAVADVMSAPVVTVAADCAVHEAAERLRDNDIKKLPVAEDGDLVGIVTASDLARYVPEYRLRVTGES